ncbi:uncharacterized protein KY384_001126 [Bacidia gigantensis]|uniref:uncharacterized protein n=1 Tax=Bacidia gigantensis TaxID=2732470 RepID=UPI001D03802D|nr:uncharacterized protein KY384_001126 [Bacidia gigantensis]KAG8534282.1 hypothetical protein KY384_001126 [Bacidia gigantensis]
MSQQGSISPLRPSPRRSPQKTPPKSSSPVSPTEPQRQPPQRPPRPNFVPPMLQNPTSQPSTNYWEDSHATLSGYSSSSRPTTTSSISTASIPDFPPIPSMPSMPPPSFQTPLRRNLGPPPSARRGASSYYSQTSFVPPIPEEMSDPHSSYASSGVVPESWGDGPPEYYMGTGIEEEDEEEADDRSMRPSEDSSGRQSKNSDYGETTNLVKGPPRTKPLQPFMETIESGDESASQSSSGRRGRRELDWQARQDERFRQGPGVIDPIGRHNFRGGGNLQHPYSGYASDATFLDSPRSGSPPVPKPLPLNTGSSKGSPVDPRIGAIMSNLEKGGAIGSSRGTSPGLSRAPSVDDRSSRRPPPLNLEPQPGNKTPGRSSQSSLPELIRRATRLATQLDRGKTTSRVGVLDMLNKKDMERRDRDEKGSRDGSISDMLAAFPSPTPTASPGFSKPVGWGAASPHGKSNLSRAQTVTYGSSRSRQTHRRGRRCCGMPIWAFILLLIILLLLIAAAVVIPVTLVVIPKQNKASNPTAESCKTSNACLNGGVSVVLNKQCHCICSGRHTGATCNQDPDTDCTTTSIQVQNSTTSPVFNYPDATLGLSIPRILEAAQANFSITLSGWRIAALFNYNNQTCTNENALITFNSKSIKPKARRRRKQRSLLQSLFHPHSEDQDPLDDSPTLVSHPSKSKTLRARASAQSSNGIVFAPGTAPGETGTTPASSSPTFASSPTDNTPSMSTKPITPLILDFARTAVLFVLQETGDLGQATTAMTKINVLLGGDDPPANSTVETGQQSLGSQGLTVDLGALTVGFGNGTLFGGKGGTV